MWNIDFFFSMSVLRRKNEGSPARTHIVSVERLDVRIIVSLLVEARRVDELRRPVCAVVVACWGAVPIEHLDLFVLAKLHANNVYTIEIMEKDETTGFGANSNR